MTENQRIWAQSRNELVQAVTTLGYPAELAELMARELKSPKAIDRMTSYVRQVRPQSEEMLVDEMPIMLYHMQRTSSMLSGLA